MRKSIEELGKCLERVADAHNEGYDVGYWAGKRDYEPKWIPVTERLPEDLQNVLVIDDGHVTIGHCEHYYGEEEVFVEWHDTLYYPIEPPCWMPLPAPPVEEKNI